MEGRAQLGGPQNNITVSVHSWTLIMIMFRPCGIQESIMVAPRMDSQQMYRPLAAVYNS